MTSAAPKAKGARRGARRAGLRSNQTMCTNDIDTQRLIGRSTNRYLIGQDTEGRGHFYDPCWAIVWVKRPAKDCIEVSYETRNLRAWKEYVDERCGWDWHNISSGDAIELVAEELKDSIA